ncbi:hypothetical protein RJT34_14004 [Clitoria ternatea]|uniref:Protein TIFY n=1 Tax=Clitoria ternatea TaxID=43366 RepID=A0AAN9JS65_CLITE
MRRNCNLELALFPCNSDHRNHMVEEASVSPMQNYLNHHHQEQQQPLTIIYDGKICVADVTEFQAKSILTLANKKMEERVRTTEACSASAMVGQYQLSPGSGLSMKRSLQRFLQKRKNRVQEASPYHR